MATETAWLNGEKMEEITERAEKLLTGIGLLMEGLSRVGTNENQGRAVRASKAVGVDRHMEADCPMPSKRFTF